MIQVITGVWSVGFSSLRGIIEDWSSRPRERALLHLGPPPESRRDDPTA
jgi:hypothetical protein